MKKIFTFLALTLTFAATAQDIVPDDGFGTNGLSVIELSSNGLNDFDSAIQEDGKIIITGERTIAPNNEEFYTARLNTDGSPDLSFANNGFFTDVQFEFPPNRTQIFFFDNDIIIVTGLGVIRLDVNGELVTSFGDNGVFGNTSVFNEFGTGSPSALIGDVLYSVGSNSTLFALNLNTGTSNTINLSNFNGIPIGVYLGANNLLYVECRNRQTFTDAVTAIDVNGNVNTAFGNNGTLVIQQSNTEEELDTNVSIYILDAFENLYATSRISNAEGTTTIVRKFDTNGNLVANFSDNGIVSIPNTLVTALDILEDQLYLAGAELLADISSTDSQLNLSVVRLNTETGDQDTTFNNTGSFVFNSNSEQEVAIDFNAITENTFIVSGGKLDDTQFVARFINSNLLSTNDTALPTNSIRFKNPITTDVLAFSSAISIDNISLYNTLGRKVAFTKNTNEINTSTLSNGTYFAHLTLKNKQIITKKVIINR